MILNWPLETKSFCRYFPYGFLDYLMLRGLLWENNGFLSFWMIALTFYRCHPAHFLQTLLQNRPIWRLRHGEECFQFGEGRVQSLSFTEPESQSAWTTDRTVSGNFCLGVWMDNQFEVLG